MTLPQAMVLPSSLKVNLPRDAIVSYFSSAIGDFVVILTWHLAKLLVNLGAFFVTDY